MRDPGRSARFIPLFVFSVWPLLGQETPVRTAKGRPVEEKVAVERVVVNARAIDRFGRPIGGLEPQGFRVQVDGCEVPLESAEWVAAGEASIMANAATSGDSPAQTSFPRAGRERLIVMLFQWNVLADQGDIEGYQRMRYFATRFLRSLAPTDRVAVLNLSGRLWFQQDFTGDPARIQTAIHDLQRMRNSPLTGSDGDFSLAAGLRDEDCRSATSMEKALSVIGNALKPLPGPKSLVLFGWGLGRYFGYPGGNTCMTSGVQFTQDYETAKRALVGSHTAVFSLDISNTDFSPLAPGLQMVSSDTGGFYMKTHLFPQLALQKFDRTTSGYYVLVFRKPEGKPGLHAIRVDLVSRRGSVLARRFYED